MRYAFAGDRAIAVTALMELKKRGYAPLALLVSGPDKASHAGELTKLSGLDPDHVLEGTAFKEEKGRNLLKSLNLDYIIGIHFPYVVPAEVLGIPRIGVLNLHPAFLPYNRGWHTPSWAIVEGTPYGATLHFMTEALDEGDVVLQRECPPLPGDTAHSLYQRVLALEGAMFAEAIPLLATLNPPRQPQNSAGTAHARRDLGLLQPLDPEENVRTGDLLKRLRALTTNKTEEAAYLIEDGRKYFIQVTMTPETENTPHVG
ncbi:formyltransferase family protein [Dinghuibacter silviterrae]|uniref:Methionyl-tRNA formyltransferase n=1 Tax=Dinghuibacter silviterrae TaxID=1539049 RepID=A0A4R8DQ66_9BACT|nr:formyltransferase family protein [Dinghuibacter silviterrae]TDX00049.1 methionyl-tRNA formyltransferase [Dinghuibacter silviterrae]